MPLATCTYITESLWDQSDSSYVLTFVWCYSYLPYTWNTQLQHSAKVISVRTPQVILRFILDRTAKNLSESDVDSFFSNILFQGNQCQLPIVDGRDKTYLEILWAAAFLIIACLWFLGGFGTSWRAVLWDGITLCKLAAFWILEVALDVLWASEPAGIDIWLVLDCE